MPLLFNILLELLVTALRQKKKKGMQIGKERLKVSLPVDDMILYTESPYGITKILFKLFNSTQLQDSKLVFVAP